MSIPDSRIQSGRVKAVPYLLLSMSIAALLAGCQPKIYYDRPGATSAMFEKDSAECKSLARQMGSERSNAKLSFGYGESGFGPGRGTSDGSFMETRDDDQYYRQYQKCLQQKGWKKVPKPARR